MENLGKIVMFLIILIISSFTFLIFREQILFIDKSLFYLINGLSNPFLDTVFIIITYFGALYFWVLVIIIAWLKKEKKMAIYLIYAIIINSTLTPALKWIFRRTRPSESLIRGIVIERGIGPSFPSGHTEMAFSGATILSYFYKILEFETAFYIIAILVAVSRIYLGVHYPLDTLFGALIGIIMGNIILNLPTQKTQEKIEGIIYRFKTFFKERFFQKKL